MWTGGGIREQFQEAILRSLSLSAFPFLGVVSGQHSYSLCPFAVKWFSFPCNCLMRHLARSTLGPLRRSDRDIYHRKILLMRQVFTKTVTNRVVATYESGSPPLFQKYPWAPSTGFLPCHFAPPPRPHPVKGIPQRTAEEPSAPGMSVVCFLRETKLPDYHSA